MRPILIISSAFLLSACAVLDYFSGVPRSPNDFFTRGSNAYQQKQYQQAISDYSITISLQPNHVNAYFYRGLAQYKRNNYDSAIADYSSAISLQPEHAEAYYWRSLAYSAKGDYVNTINDAQSAQRFAKQHGPDYVLNDAKELLDLFRNQNNSKTQGETQQQKTQE